MLHKTIDSVLQRGEKLDTLVERSEQLGVSSRAFYKTGIARNLSVCPAIILTRRSEEDKQSVLYHSMILASSVSLI